MPVREISNDSLNGELTAAGDKLVLVDFFATWFEQFVCPCISFLSEQILGAVHVKQSLHILKI